jgi:hypothetical protein
MKTNNQKLLEIIGDRALQATVYGIMLGVVLAACGVIS